MKTEKYEDTIIIMSSIIASMESQLNTGWDKILDMEKESTADQHQITQQTSRITLLKNEIVGLETNTKKLEKKVEELHVSIYVLKGRNS